MLQWPNWVCTWIEVSYFCRMYFCIRGYCINLPSPELFISRVLTQIASKPQFWHPFSTPSVPRISSENSAFLPTSVERRQVSVDALEQLARSLNVMWMETSAKSGFNVKNLFRRLALMVPTPVFQCPGTGKKAVSKWWGQLHGHQMQLFGFCSQLADEWADTRTEDRLTDLASIIKPAMRF